MTSILLDLSGKADPSHVHALSIMKGVADALLTPFFVVGATARDYILELFHNRPPHRMTKDIDLAVQVETWSQYDKLIKALLAAGKFAETPEKHRFRCDGVPVDIVPFGALAGKDKVLRWPPEQEIIMSVLGFRTAPLLEVKVPTLAGLALIKLMAWNDAYPNRQKDAEDLLFIMQSYEDAGNRERLYAEAQAMLEEEGFDTRLAGVRLLGQDMARLANPDTRQAAKAILDKETGERSRHRLAFDMLKGRLPTEEKLGEITQLLEKLHKGFAEAARTGGA
jgi:predicted nucleotidyltransferase